VPERKQPATSNSSDSFSSAPTAEPNSLDSMLLRGVTSRSGMPSHPNGQQKSTIWQNWKSDPQTNYKKRTSRRLEILNYWKSSRKRRIECLAKCKADPVFFATNWIWAEDPRNIPKGIPAKEPFDPWQEQIDFIVWLEKQWRAMKSCLAEKSRESL